MRSHKQEAALRVARLAGGLQYIPGGIWIGADKDPERFVRSSAWNRRRRCFIERPWYTTTRTVRSLVKRGLMKWTPTDTRPQGAEVV